MSFFLFRIRLLCVLILFLHSLFWLHVKQIRTFFYTIALMSVIVVSMLVHIQQTKLVSENKQLLPVTLPQDVPHADVSFTLSSAEERYRQLRSLQQTYLPHRDVLINISLLTHSIGKDSISQESFEQAQRLDPNAQVFKKQ